MSFEGEFPELAGVSCRTFTDRCLMKTCKSKQRVKEAVMRLPDDNRRHILLKELKL